jgi:hypothetical protein
MKKLIIFFLVLLVLVTSVLAFVSYQPIYKVEQREVSTYRVDVVEIPSIYNDQNKTWSEPYNYTIRVDTGKKIEYFNESRIGFKIGSKDYLGYNNIKGNNLIEWTVPIGDRNFDEFGSCRDYEKQKGVCKETSLFSEVLIK